MNQPNETPRSVKLDCPACGAAITFGQAVWPDSTAQCPKCTAKFRFQLGSPRSIAHPLTLGAILGCVLLAGLVGLGSGMAINGFVSQQPAKGEVKPVKDGMGIEQANGSSASTPSVADAAGSASPNAATPTAESTPPEPEPEPVHLAYKWMPGSVQRYKALVKIDDGGKKLQVGGSLSVIGVPGELPTWPNRTFTHASHGMVVSEQGHIVMPVDHVTRAKSLEVRIGRHRAIGKLIATNDDLRVALIECNMTEAVPARFSQLAAADDSPVRALKGADSHSTIEFTNMEGTVIATSGKGSNSRLRTRFLDGNPTYGLPVVDMRGGVVGLQIADDFPAEGQVACLPSNLLLPWLKEKGVNTQVADNQVELNAPQTILTHLNSVVHVRLEQVDQLGPPDGQCQLAINPMIHEMPSIEPGGVWHGRGGAMNYLTFPITPFLTNRHGECLRKEPQPASIMAIGPPDNLIVEPLSAAGRRHWSHTSQIPLDPNAFVSPSNSSRDQLSRNLQRILPDSVRGLPSPYDQILRDGFPARESPRPENAFLRIGSKSEIIHATETEAHIRREFRVHVVREGIPNKLMCKGESQATFDRENGRVSASVVTIESFIEDASAWKKFVFQIDFERSFDEKQMKELAAETQRRLDEDRKKRDDEKAAKKRADEAKEADEAARNSRPALDAVAKLSLPDSKEHLAALRELADGFANRGIRGQVVKAIEPFLENTDPEILATAVRAMAVWNDENPSRQVVELLDHAHADVRKEAFHAIAASSVVEQLNKLIDRLSVADDRDNVVAAILSVGKRLERPIVAHGLTHGDTQVRLASCRILAKIATSRASVDAIRKVASETGEIGDAAKEALVTIGEPYESVIDNDPAKNPFLTPEEKAAEKAKRSEKAEETPK